MFNKSFIDYLKAHYQISPKPEIKEVLLLLNLDIASYNLTGLEVKLSEKSIEQKDTAQMYGELKQTLTYTLQNDATEFHRNEDEFKWAQMDFLTHIV